MGDKFLGHSTDGTYYCEITDENWEFPAGVVSITFRREYMTKLARMISYSDKVWYQGPRGGVKIIKDTVGIEYGYITTNNELMKQFMWVKLQAQPYNEGA